MNFKSDTVKKIIEYLYHSKDKPVSGVSLSELLGVSRVAVWKHIDALREAGMGISSSPKGYLLDEPDDLLLPFCFKEKYQDRIFHFQQTGSTMDEARKLAGEGCPHMSVVVAEQQNLGRGRLNRKWFSAKGGLWFTLILRPDIPPPMAYIYNFAASLSLSQSISSLFGIQVSVKWPNDLLLEGRKLAGLLSEMETRGDMIRFISIGIGINVNNSPEKDEPKAISLRSTLGKTVSRKKILQAFLDDFQNRTERIDCAQIIEQWKQQTSTIGSSVRIETLGETFEGLAVDVDETGALIIKDDGGATRKIIYGDCFHS